MTSSSLLSQVTSGVQPTSDVVMLMGVKKVGKSTFLAESPEPIVIPAEPGIDEIDIPAFPVQTTFQGVLDCVQALIDTETPYKTLGIDTLDALELSLHEEICRKHGKSTIMDFNHGRGYALCLPHWKELIVKLTELRDKRGMNIICTVHDKLREVANPAGEDYLSYTPALSRGASALFENWSKAIVFAAHEEIIKEGKAVRTGRRVLRTQHSSGWSAGNRYNLPHEIDFSWKSYEESRERYRSKSLEEMRNEAKALLAECSDEEVKANATEWFTKNKDNQRAFRTGLDALKEKVAQ